MGVRQWPYCKRVAIEGFWSTRTQRMRLHLPDHRQLPDPTQQPSLMRYQRPRGRRRLCATRHSWQAWLYRRR
ncbi:rCG43752 [Rattus norvegicus]|uniref:RCG43752 n=1 Tax=Rattus norvegicus TaxID=10116 RepID=A6JJ06_RAT|nr:rCG43752 [Rattus norvegicus]